MAKNKSRSGNPFCEGELRSMAMPGDEEAKESSGAVTALLRAWSNGEAGALDQLTPLVYVELRRLAHRQMGHERAGHSLQTTALVNEAYLRLVDCNRMRWV